MAIVKFTSHLKRFYPSLSQERTHSINVKELIDELEQKYSGISDYLLDSSGQLREHVNVFLNGEMIVDREKLGDSLKADDEVYIMQAISGG